ncbi:hypothetical protein ERO13_A10G044700v2 [Gossypium hirsutum]|uniref:Uncharacterized protein LOC107937518 n=2 Tax=Gossypium TaxID=3633 RepID=A0A1U8MGK3_GOSHI|nr:uncharacterized protein LOC107937518 [Gossypium hirsutum]XP_040935568.1 uncharacterized protein LOC107937518 [Gossypium hirsutum]KAB2060867.1 hypothetical protein ES319_A10G048500v1 [Gossypium barbadense]KAG4178475.1 hypothetical protein ERO13_A10G044700v2 [Gossypium hirsutum]KAG4178476.1 hypothetical protein ERO13_A10G044700v2 [Gossypium hirsutum]
MGDAMKNSFPGGCPEFGAIFMSNNATKRECFRRKVFALPYSQYHFVKQVKAGMILFLFEFERRELHGVFQACSDGEMNILPHAFNSSGKQYPAQVKFIFMWNCHPLSENEFRDAIRENYFSKHKFKFGLSEDQVRRLLSLFNLKRMKDQAPQRWLTGSKVAWPSGYSTSKTRRLVDNSPMNNQMPRECGVDNHHGLDISTMHQGDSFYNDDRQTDDGRFGTYTDVEYEHKASAFLNECFRDLMGKVEGNIVSGEYARSDRVDTEWKTGMELQPAVSAGYSSGNFRSISKDVRFAKSDRTETKCYKDDGFAPTISTAYPTSFQSKVNPLVYSSKHVLETGSFIDDPIRPSSAFLPSMEMQNSNVSYPMNFEDSIVTNSLPHELDVPTMNHWGSSYSGFSQEHASLQEYASHDSCVGHVIGTSKNQSIPSLLETRRTVITSDVNSGSGDFIPLPYSNSYECSSRTSLQRPDYLDDLAAEYSKKECCGDLSLLKPSLAHVTSEIRNNVRINEHSSSYRTSPSKFPSLTFSDRYPTSIQDRYDFQVPERESDIEFGNDGFMFKECQPHGESFYNDNRTIEDRRFAIYKKVENENKEGQQHIHEPVNVDYHEVTSLSPPPYQNSDRRKKRSVFSRLALPHKRREPESNTPLRTADIDRHSSVNEVMDILHRSRKYWVKTSCKQLLKHNDDADNFRDKKQVTRKEGSAMMSKEMNVKSTSFSKENSNQKQVTRKEGSAMISKETNVKSTSSSKGNSSQKQVTRKEGSAMNSKEINVKSTSFSRGNSSQRPGESTFVDFKRRSAVRKNLEDGKIKTYCETLKEKSAPAAQSKKRKLIRPDFRENESSDLGVSVDAPELVIVASAECSVNKNAESIRISVVDVNEKDLLLNVKLPNAVRQTAIKGNNSDKEGSSFNSEQFNAESFLASGSADEGRKESLKNHCTSSMTSISCGNMHVDIKQAMTAIGIDGFSQDRNDASHSTFESSPKICEHNDGDGAAKSEFVYSIEQMNDLTPVGGEISISTLN